MLGSVRARALSRAIFQCPPLIRPRPTSWIVRLASTNGDNSHGSSNHGESNSQEGSDHAPFHSSHTPSDFDPSPPAPPPIDASSGVSGGGIENWSAAAQDVASDAPSSLSPLISDAGGFLLSGVVYVGGQVIDGVQAGVQGVHAVTGLPWWATIAVVTVGVKISLLPVVVHQARHMDRMRGAWPEIQMLRKHLADTLEEVRLRHSTNTIC